MPAPVRVTGPAAWRWALRFALDPLMATRRAFAAFGPFVVLAEALPVVKRPRAVLVNVPLVLTAGAAFNRELLSDPETWRGVSLLPGGPKNSAARRLAQGLTRTTGQQHAHYRKLVAPPLRRTSVHAMAEKMAQLAEAEVALWPAGETIDIWEFPRRVMRNIAVELLFGGSSEDGYFIADAVSRLMEGKWGGSAFALRINLPFTSYGRIVRDSALVERRLLEWARTRCGKVCDRDLVSIIVNSSDADGNPPSDAVLAGQIPSLFAAAFEAGQSALTWTLLLLAQHPHIAARLLDELRSKMGRTSPSLSDAGELSYLDAVVRESMRILPPVPFQMRVAQRDTKIFEYPVPKGARVILNTFLTNRMPHPYPDGDVFRPERWFTIAPSAFEFPVFSAGPHSCPGYWFGSTAVKIALAAILMRYRLVLAPNTRVDYRVQPTMRPLRPVHARLHPQDGAFAATPLSGRIRDLVTLPP
ncbi:MAG TPA: cytochrome P450 [Xanthobacteraceae bacterium]|jgi:cytochrome P450|nr:cytochrome P450 [Xanthobacteraceae bacterium]